MKLINIGFGNMVASSRLIAIVSRNPHRSSAPCRRPATAAWSWTAPTADAPAPCSSWTATMWCSVLCSRRPLRLVLRARPRKENQKMRKGNVVCIHRTVRCRQGHSAVQAAERGRSCSSRSLRRPVRRVRAKRTAYSIISSRKRTLRRRSPQMRSSSTRSTLITTTARWRLR